MQQPAAGFRPGGEPGAVSGLARLTSTKAAALRSMTLARTWEPSLASVLAPLLARAVPPPGWRVPQASPPMGGAGTVLGGRCYETPDQRHIT
jgi:hypothetical protein